jgi:hypothetical protein
MFSSPQGEREAARLLGPAGNHHLIGESGTKDRIETVRWGSPVNGMQDASSGRPGWGTSVGWSSVFLWLWVSAAVGFLGWLVIFGIFPGSGG